MKYEIDEHNGLVSVFVYVEGYNFSVALHGTKLQEHDSLIFGHCLDVYNGELYVGSVKHVDTDKITRNGKE